MKAISAETEAPTESLEESIASAFEIELYKYRVRLSHDKGVTFLNLFSNTPNDHERIIETVCKVELAPERAVWIVSVTALKNHSKK